MKIGYKSWDEAKQAIRDKPDELLEIGKEPGVQRLRFEFDIDYELLPTVEYTTYVQKSAYRTKKRSKCP